MSRPLVSICMPAYNVEDYVADALDSALGQTWGKMEINVVNDGSTDRTADVIEGYADHEQVTVIHQGNQGAATARNRAYGESSGELIKFFDGDDLLSPEFVERQVKHLDGSTTHVASAEWARFYDDPSEAGDLNLVADLDPGPLEAFSTDFTELSYADGNRKAYLMAVFDLESKYVPGWAVGPSASRKLAMRCWEQVRERMASLGEGLGEKIIHHDLDSVLVGYRWLEAVLLDDEMRVSYSENGAKGNPWIESLWGRTKDEIGSRITEASSLPALRSVFDERFQYYNRERTCSSIGYIPPREHLGQTLSAYESEPQIAAAS